MMIKVNGDVLKVGKVGLRAEHQQFAFSRGIAHVYTLTHTSRPRKGVVRMNSYVVEYTEAWWVILAPYALDRAEFEALINRCDYIGGVSKIPADSITQALQTVALMA
jgi:hypothetical protein